MSQQPLKKVIPQRALDALADFFRLEAAGGIVLIIAACAALMIANSPYHPEYLAFCATQVQFRIGDLNIDKPLSLWVNDGLMAIFFLMVALEIKREAVSGQLSERSQLVLPMVCAAAGVAVPALIFTAFNSTDASAMRGWAVPTATDIAFALGVLALLGSRVPTGLKLLLSTIAVVDDLIAIVIIAVFYSHELALMPLALAAVTLTAMWVLNLRGVTALGPYLLLGVVLWFFVLKSGVHATLAGVATGLMIPHISKKNAIPDDTEHSPLETLEHEIHPWVVYAVLPLFAFINAGLSLRGIELHHIFSPLPMGVVFGLVIGKPIGIVGASLLLRATGLARFPDGMNFSAMIGLGLMCGIGFTMSLFISSLAYSDPALYQESVIGILLASAISAVAGYAWLRASLAVRAGQKPA